MKVFKIKFCALCWTMLILSLLTSTSVLAKDSDLHKSVDGYSVYLGVLPAEMIRGYPKDHTESLMHGGIPTDHRYHLTVALFDSMTGKRITDTNIEIQVLSDSGSSQWKVLEKMLIGGMQTYGNYFSMPAGNVYQIKVKIHRPASTRATTVLFSWGRS